MQSYISKIKGRLFFAALKKKKDIQVLKFFYGLDLLKT